jgi:hypothetical protein
LRWAAAVVLGDTTEPASEEPASEEPASGEPASGEPASGEPASGEHGLEVRHHHATSSAEGRRVEVDLVRRMHQHFVAECSLLSVVPRRDIGASLCVSIQKAQ